MLTRAAAKAHTAQQLFRQTAEDPCVIHLIATHLCARDIVALKQVSKDARFQDALDHVLKRLRTESLREKKCVKKIWNYLTHIDSLAALGSEFQLPIVVKLYTYLCNIEWLLDKWPSFAQVAHDKLIEQMTAYPPFAKHAVKFLRKLFDLEEPRHHYDANSKRIVFGMRDMHGRFVHLNLLQLPPLTSGM